MKVDIWHENNSVHEPLGKNNTFHHPTLQGHTLRNLRQHKLHTKHSTIILKQQPLYFQHDSEYFCDH